MAKAGEEAELGKKIAARGYLKGAITRMLSFVHDLSLHSHATCMAKRERLLDVFKQYELICQEIIYCNPDDPEDVGIVESHYFTILTALDEAIREKSPVPPPSQTQPSTSHFNSSVNFPPITIQNFDGKFTEYVPFINLFESMIHKDKSLDLIQKLYYLRSFLVGEPLDLIKNLPLCADSYNEALLILKNRYDNKNRIVSGHIGNLLDLKPLSRSTAENLRSFIATVKQQLVSIKNLNPNVIYWDAIIICILTRKLDSYTARAYQFEKDLEAEPKLEDFIKFLENRAKALENDQCQGQQQQSTRPSNKATALVGVAPGACKFCIDTESTNESKCVCSTSLQ